MTQATAARLSGDRLHLQHGPIDLVIGVDGDREAAFARATQRFATVLSGLVTELPSLRRAGAQKPSGAVARRMWDAVRPHAPVFVTPMAAVAGAVADEILSVITGPDVTRAYVNNGGDIAVFTGAGQSYRIALATHDGRKAGTVTIDPASGIGGVATSGRHGRSHSLGIADSVTVLARCAAGADAAATLIANAVDCPGHPSVARRPARDLDPDSDLGDMHVVTACGPLGGPDIDAALARGSTVAQSMLDRQVIRGAALFLHGRSRIIGASRFIETEHQEKVALHA